MASLIENLLDILEKENEAYKKLIPIAQEKTKIIVNNDLQALQEITEQEQVFVDAIGVLERKREEVIVNIGIVMNKKPETLNFKTLVKILEKQPDERKALCAIHDRLYKTVNRLVHINNHNKSLIQQSLEMIEFNMNFIQSTRMLPGSNNYSKTASTTDILPTTGMFDIKQ